MDQILQDKIWDFYQNEKPESFNFSMPRISYLAKLILRLYNHSSRNVKILNVGVGSGLFEDLAKKNGFDVYSLDPNQKTIDQIKQKFLAFNCVQNAKVGYIQNIPFPDGYFDMVVLSEVLEHLPDKVIENGLKDIARVLKNEGYLIGTVPARENLDDLIVLCPKCDERFHWWGHLQSFDRNNLNLRLEKYFKVKKIYENYFIPFELNWKGKLFAYLKKILTKLGIHGRGENIVFIVKK